MKLSLLTSISIHKVFFNITQKLFKLFVPVLIYERTKNLYLTILYLFFEQLIRAIITLCLRKVSGKKPILLISLSLIPFFCLQILFLFDIAITLWLAIVIALISALSSAMYWSSANLVFVIATQKNEEAKAVSFFHIAGSIGNLIAPIVGALLIYYDYLTINVIICTLFNILALVFILSKAREINNKMQEMANIEPDPHYTKKEKGAYIFYYCLNGIRDFAIDQTLPIYLSVMAINIKLIGWAYSLLELGVILSHIITMFLSKKDNWYAVGIISSVLLGIWIFVFPFIVSSTTALIFTVVVGILNPLSYNIIFAKFVQHRDRRMLTDMVDRELSVIGIKIFPCALLTILPLSCWFITGGLAYVLYAIPYTLIKNNYKKLDTEQKI